MRTGADEDVAENHHPDPEGQIQALSGGGLQTTLDKHILNITKLDAENRLFKGFRTHLLPFLGVLSIAHWSAASGKSEGTPKTDIAHLNRA